MKRVLTLLAAALLTLSISGLAFAEEPKKEGAAPEVKAEKKETKKEGKKEKMKKEAKKEGEKKEEAKPAKKPKKESAGC